MLYFCTYKFEYCLYVTNDNMDGHRAQDDDQLVVITYTVSIMQDSGMNLVASAR